MKAGLLAVAALAAVVVAQPHRRHQALHERDAAMETAWFTEIDVVTATAPAAYVYVDQNGNPIAAPAATSSAAAVVQHGNWNGEEQGNHGHEHSAPAAIPTTTTVAPVAAPAPTTTTAAAVVVPVVSIPVVSIPAVPIVPVSIAPVVIPVPSSPAVPVASSVAGSSGGDGLGVTYTPYTGGPCRNAAQVAKDIAGLSKYSSIRLYGTDCNQIANVMDAMGPNQKVMLSVFDIDGRQDAEVQSLKDQVNGRWSRVSAISIGNERLSNGNDAATVIAAVQRARSQLSSSFSGPIGTVDTVDNYQANHGALCATADQDTIFVNCHPFWGHVTPENAGGFVKEQIAELQKTCNVKNVVITETGWPSQSVLLSSFTSDWPKVPNLDAQISAINSITGNFSSNLFLFSAYNEPWKPINAATNGVEQFWGFMGNAPSS